MLGDGRRAALTAAVAALGAAGAAGVAGACGDRDAARRRADSAAAAELEQRCGRASDAVVGVNGVGPVRLGATLEEAGRQCPVAAGDPPQGHAIARIERRPLVLATRGGVITGITITDAAFRTDRGVGVGTPLATLRFAYGRLCAVAATDGPAVLVAGLDGLAFDVGSLPMRLEGAPAPLRRDSLADLARITRVRIGDAGTRCPRR